MRRLIVIIIAALLLLSSCAEEGGIDIDSYRALMIHSWAHSLEGMDADIVFMGDSLSHLADFPKAFKGAEKAICNTATGGDRVENEIEKICLVDALEPETVIILIGGNNALGGRESVEEFLSLYKNLLELLHARSKANGGYIERIYVESIFPIGKGYSGKSGEKNKWIHSANSGIEKLAGLYDEVEFVDIHSSFEDGEGYLRAELTPDTIHLNEKGNEIWYHELREHIPELRDI